ncbi:hypothetical protein FGK63_08505 [Ruegeria sediminis]|uniref:Uncharacterized protein n=1 Tax=Ruegeria sediminis TaxID=2583820 RepID=A0ABY2X2I3_9RHOB|nr:hypothetical protein [Ruegeria sediminis]TMV09139.1 hypothetical protein FGK63_08505 [Ruegeria sediminis]
MLFGTDTPLLRHDQLIFGHPVCTKLEVVGGRRHPVTPIGAGEHGRADERICSSIRVALDGDVDEVVSEGI